MMTTPSQGHLDQRTGDIDFPLWVKAVAGILAVCTPLGLSLVGWLTVQVVEMRSSLDHLGTDRLTKTEFLLYMRIQDTKDLRQNERISNIEQDLLSGR